MSQGRLAPFLDACGILRRLKPTAPHEAVTPMLIMTSHRRFPAQGRYHIAHARGACPPGSEVPRRIQVGVDLETASLTFDEGLLRPVATLGVATAGAALRRVMRVFLDDLDIDQCRRWWEGLRIDQELDAGNAALAIARVRGEDRRVGN